jgi:3-hydroxyacyl-[acyl-carrier-protein] dehydratase
MNGNTTDSIGATQAEGTDTSGVAVGTVDIARIMQAIPHRYPFLLIDRVVDLVTNESAVGIKNVSVNENFFQGLAC